MTVTPQLVKELRDRTMAGMMDCKKALEACDCDMEKAIVWLREKGIAKAEKKASRVAAEGLCSYVIDGNDCVLFELNSETDFVAKNDKFLALLDKVGQIISASDATNTEEALNITVEGKTLENIILEDSAVIGEKVSLRRVQRITKENSQISVLISTWVVELLLLQFLTMLMKLLLRILQCTLLQTNLLMYLKQILVKKSLLVKGKLS